VQSKKPNLTKSPGFQVAPAELEGLLLDHPAIDDVAVIGVYEDSQATEVPRAYVVLSKSRKGDDHTAVATEIIEWTAKQVANHKRLRGGVRFIDEIPKSVSGKILRRILKVQAAEEQKKAAAGSKAKL